MDTICDISLTFDCDLDLGCGNVLLSVTCLLILLYLSVKFE